MKRLIKNSVLILLIISSCFLFTSCKQLDELKSKQAFINDTSDEITIGGKIYKRIDLPSNTTVMSADAGRLNVTKKDVPVLLSTSFRFAEDYFIYAADKDVIYANDCVYCTDEKFGDYKNAAEAPLDYFCYTYYALTDENDYKEVDMVLSKEYCECISSALLTPCEKAENIGEVLGYWDLTHCDEYGLLETYSSVNITKVATSEGYEYFVEDDYYAYTDYVTVSRLHRITGEENKALMEKLTSELTVDDSRWG